MTHLARTSLLFTLLLCTCVRAQAQGIDFFSGTWAEALEKAATEDKLIFVDAYAEWCGPCKRMAADVFPAAEVGDYYNGNFISVKMDMEKVESEEFRQNHSARAYPTLLFINAENEVVHKVVGARSKDGLIQEGGNALNKLDNLEDLALAWAEQDRTPKLALRYVRAMVRQQENHAKVTNDYLRDQQDLTTPENLDILLVAATDADSRIFDLMVKNKAAIIARAGQEAFDRQVKTAVTSTKNKALEYGDEKLLAAAVKKFATIDKVAAEAFELQGAFEMTAAGDDLKSFQKATKKYLAKAVDGDMKRLHEVYRTASASKFIDDEKIFAMAVEAEAASARLDATDGYRKYYRLAEFMLNKGKSNEALTYAQASKNAISHLTAGKRKATARSIDGLIAKIEAAR
ncbi:thioredoxin family protein [Neolewinella antarctica]|uniref:Thiol-disulfide isomerase/thioredoxin n=1 Tax=Neolewinella antarctica TaxID=442734 RepID=A0ABX0XF94_9BACT|nr:thioredoxin domain-containing protein [Neolewinella antarctica]NJC27553.1 thiol-disulfide isomerase/thioredoxin [Neolewinella antarctica]